MTCGFVRRMDRFARVGVAALALCGAAHAGGPIAEAESFEWLGDFGPLSNQGPYLVNENGDVLFSTDLTTPNQFQFYIQGQAHPISMIGAFSSINASRTAVGRLMNFPVVFDLPNSFALGREFNVHLGINNAGDIVGLNNITFAGYKIENGQTTHFPVRFVPGGIDSKGRVFGRDLSVDFVQTIQMIEGGGPPTLVGPGDTAGAEIFDVTERGDLAGAVRFEGEEFRPFVFIDGQPRLLDPAPDITALSYALTVTTRQHIIGVDQSAIGLHEGWVVKGDQRVAFAPLFTPMLGYQPNLRFYGSASEAGWVVGVGTTPEGAERVFRAKIRVAVNPNQDSDGDGLLDDWEENGIPYTDSQCATQRYMLPNANPARKDLYVEVDGGTFPLSDDSIARVVFAFDQAPVTNPDDSTGIRLHVVKDEFDLLLPNSVVVAPRRLPENYTVIKGERFGTPEERQGPDAAARLEAKAKAFRYCIAYDGIEFQNGVGAYSGLGRIRGADFVIDLGLPVLRNGIRDIDEVAGVFMHELGHNLGLDHGGGDTIHGKPNYVSVMNYAWTMPKPFSLRFWRLDYSREALATLQENDLSETAGINSMLYRGVSMPFGVGPELARSMRLVKLSGRPTDFDGSGGTPSGIVDADLNFIGPGAGIPGTGSPTPSQPLTGHNDWPALIYAINPNQIISARGDLDDGFPDGCPTAESIEFLSKNVPEPCHPDIDGDNFIGFADLNAVISRFNTLQGETLYDAAVDIDADGLIGFSDLNEVLSRFNEPCP